MLKRKPFSKVPVLCALRIGDFLVAGKKIKRVLIIE